MKFRILKLWRILGLGVHFYFQNGHFMPFVSVSQCGKWHMWLKVLGCQCCLHTPIMLLDAFLLGLL